MPAFTHVIVTRFNLSLWGGAEPNEAWLQSRFELFRSYCYPSVKGQSVQSFRWVVLFSENTPDKFRRQVDELANWPVFCPVYLEKFHSKRTIQAILDVIEPGSTHLITTTLDNDDALASDFVETVQARFTGQSWEIINFTNGLRLDVRSNKLYDCAVLCNPFITLYETLSDAPTTILRCLPHSTTIERYGVVHEIESAPMWLQVVHGRNADATGVVGRLRAQPHKLERFELASGISVHYGSQMLLRLENVRRRIERIIINLSPDSLKMRIRRASWGKKRAKREL